jgi:DNA-binding XRE family transcriptional regulator
MRCIWRSYARKESYRTMSGHRSFKELSGPIDADPVRRTRVEELGRAYDALIALHELREALGLTQAELAGQLGVSQPNVSKIEGSGADLKLSTLAGYLKALGGHLEVRAVFPDQPEYNVSLALGPQFRSQQEPAER